MAEATAQMMRACVLAATRPWTELALRGLSLWSEMILASGDRPRSTEAGSRARAAQDTPAGSYSSFRSGGGHASTQVIIADQNAPPRPFTALAGLAPMYGMLDAWRAALGAGQRN